MPSVLQQMVSDMRLPAELVTSRFIAGTAHRPFNWLVQQPITSEKQLAMTIQYVE
jgi:hypothetical protein